MMEPGDEYTAALAKRLLACISRMRAAGDEAHAELLTLGEPGRKAAEELRLGLDTFLSAADYALPPAGGLVGRSASENCLGRMASWDGGAARLSGAAGHFDSAGDNAEQAGVTWLAACIRGLSESARVLAAALESGVADLARELNDRRAGDDWKS